MHALRRFLAILGLASIGLLGPAVVPAPSSMPVMASHPAIEQLLPGLPAAHATGGNWTQTNEFRTQLLSGTFGNLTTANAVTFKLLTSSSNIGA